MEKNNFKETFAPTVVLVVICLIATVLLAGTYQITKPMIEKISKENADAARMEVLSTADGFSPVDAAMLEGVTEIYKSTNDAGMVITTSFKGFGGAVIVMTGIDTNGEITGVKVTEASSETPGLGTKATTPEHLAEFVGQTAITNVEGGEGTKVDGITGATFTSNAVFNGVHTALQQYAELGGAK